MSARSLEAFWRLARARDAVLTRNELSTWPESETRILEHMDFLRPTATARHACCTECASGHAEEVITVAHPDATRFFIACPENGRVEVSAERLAQVAPDWDRVAQWLVGALNVKGTCDPISPGVLWRLGRVSLGGKSRDAWCMRAHQCAPTDIEPLLPRTTGSVIFIYGTVVDPVIPEFPADHVIRLEEVVLLDGDEILLDVDDIAERIEGKNQENVVKKAVRRRRESRASTIDALKRSLHEHILSAYSHAKDRTRQGKEPELLPRPTQKMLAKILNISESRICNALKDNDRELKILWDTANDLDAVLKYKPR